MILKIAWRNVWRNKVRSLVVIIAIALGLWAGTFASGFYEGMINQRIESVIENEYSHIQFHDTIFRDEYALSRTLPSYHDITEKLEQESGVEAYSERVVASSMFASSYKSGGIKLMGVIPQKEAAVTQLDEKLKEGEYFEGVKRNPILISQKTAEDYSIKLRSKVVVTLQNRDREIVSASFRVVGIFSSDNNMFDKLNAYVKAEDIQGILDFEPDQYHELAVLLKDNQAAEAYADRYAQLFPDVEVLPWLDLAVGMRYMVEASSTFALIIVAIILIALLFSIVNTMLMAVMERTREIGMLKAIGLNKYRVFSMIMLETVMLSMVGLPVGLLVAYGMIERSGRVGIDLGAIGETYSDLGFAAVVYPSLPAETYISISIMVFVMAFLAAIYPSLKAIRLNASEAIRKI